MKNLKRYLAVLVAVCVMLTAAVPAFAAEALTDAEICETIGMIEGSGSGVTPEYLASTPNRMQAARLYLRLLGLEDEALAFGYEGKENFKDADKTIASGKSIMAYLYANPDLGWQGGETGNFNPAGLMQAQSYYKVMLEALGYEYNVDFTWDTVFEVAADAGLTKIADKTDITMDDVATATVEALKATVKGTEKTLIATLVEADKVDADAAELAGIYSPVKDVVATVKAVGAKKLAVEFNQAVDTTKAAFKVTKSTIAVNVSTISWNDAKTVATLELAGKMTAGDYTVATSGLTETALSGKVAVTDEKVAKIEFTSANAVLDATYATTITTSYKAYNQYSEDVTSGLPAGAALSFTASKGKTTYSAGALIINNASDATGNGLATGSNFNIAENVVVSVFDAKSTTFASATLTVAARAQVSDVEINGLYNRTDSAVATTIAKDDGKAYNLLIKAKDQYGTYLAYDKIDTGVYVSSSNPNVIEIPAIHVWEKKNEQPSLQITVKGAGTTTLSIFSYSTGKSATLDVTVKDEVKVDTITLSAPAVISAGKTVEIPFAAVDQFGNAVTDVAKLNACTINVNGANANHAVFERDYVKGVTALKLYFTSEDSTTTGMATLSIITPTIKHTSLFLNVTEHAKPAVIAGVKDFDLNVLKDNKITIDEDNVIIHDQYGREIDIKSQIPETYKFTFESSATGQVALENKTDAQVDLKGVAKGTSTITIALAGINGSAYSFNMRTIEKSEIASYELSSVAKVYDGGTNWAKDVEVKGVLADGSKVKVPKELNYYEVNLVDGDANTKYDSATGKVYADPGVSFGDASEVTGTLIVTVEGATNTELLTSTVTFCKTAPALDVLAVWNNWEVPTSTDATVEDAGAKLVSIAMANVVDEASVLADVAAVLKGTDQYGVNIGVSVAASYITNISDSKTIKNVGSATTTTVAKGTTFNVTAITTNGKSITVKVIVK